MTDNLYFIVRANLYNTLIFQFLCIYDDDIIIKYIEICVTNIKIANKIKKLHNKFVYYKQYLNNSNRFYTREPALFINYIKIIINIIENNIEYHNNTILEYYDILYDDVLNNLQPEINYLRTGYEIKLINLIINKMILLFSNDNKLIINNCKFGYVNSNCEITCYKDNYIFNITYKQNNN